MQKLIHRYRDATAIQDGGEIPALHGIRALMVLFVAAFHIWQQSWLTPRITLFGLNINLDPLLRSGYMWVDGLLLLSGFLCYLPYAHAREASRALPSITPFYRKRFFRIVPSYVFNLLIMLLAVALPQGLYKQPGDAALDLLAHLTFTHNFFRATYLSTPLNGVLWTLAVEVQFYLIFPFLARAFHRMPMLTYSLMTGMAFLFRLYAASFADNAMLINQLPAFLDVYANGFVAAGIYVSLRRRMKEDGFGKILMSVCGALAVYALWTLVRAQAGEVGAHNIRLGQLLRRYPQSVMTGLAFLGLSLGFGGVRLVLGNPITRFLSQISFQFYIWHQVVALQLRLHNIPYAAVPNPNQTGDIIWQRKYVWLSFSLALVISALATYLIEQPINRRFGGANKILSKKRR
ncbi:MAG: acyltransferase [Clostridiales bacterium]|nr:acyltransferase [Clostridiales bacterium]